MKITYDELEDYKCTGPGCLHEILVKHFVLTELVIQQLIINELKSFTGIASDIPEKEILARIKELEY